ncbi:chromosome segregation protein SMC [archaeon]|nr:chromosome segregation protein SMC [archaeon]
MTTVTKLTMSGFKSFAKKTDLTFGTNFNCVLGPNGSGKSNIMDALCFVLGKSSAKSMRAEKSANLIYNGGKKGNPSKTAEVAIYFDNSNKDFPLQEKEIKVSRIVKKNGQSVYKLNDKTLTRQQIVDILRNAKVDPDGHNIILQGDIVHFMEMRPLDRRELIEEVAGISIFEEKKNKAISELSKVEDKLIEANILLTEREVNLRELKKDRDQAKKYLDLKDKIKDNKATYLNIQTKEKQKRLDIILTAIEKQKISFRKIREKIEDNENQIQTKKSELNDINDELEKRGEQDQITIRHSITDIKTDVVKTQSRIETLKNEIIKVEARKQQLKITIEDNNKRIDYFIKERNKIEKEIKKLEKRENNLKPIKQDLGLKINELARLKAQSSGDSFSDSSIDSISNISGVYGTISQLGKANPRYALALEVTAGAKMKSVVTNNDMVAEECIQTLKQNKKGVVTFLPLNRIKPREVHPSLKELSKKTGVKGWAIDLIKFDSKYKNAFKHIFENTLIVDDIKIVRRIGIGRVRMVTLEGDLIEKSGAMIGGFRKHTRIGFKQDNIEEEMLKLESEIDALHKPSILDKQKQSITSEIIENRAKLASYESKTDYLSIENGNTYKIIEEHEKEKQEFQQELRGLTNIIQKKSVNLKDSEKREKDFFLKQKELFSRRNRLTEEIEKKNEIISEHQDKVRIIENKINSISIEKAGCMAEIEGLKKEAEEYQGGKIRKNINIEQLKKEIKDFEVFVIRMGNVNMKALEIYDKLAEEHQILVEKTNKLKSEKDDIFEMITAIEQDKTKVFMKTFNHLNKRFGEIFNSLSTKGEASIVLENPEAPLEAGLDITVKIASRKYLDIRSLSGGEKTLAALAFIFAIQEYNPASFYILDEVDAALDKHNSEKLGKLFAQYSDKAQYIVISHNDAIITEAEQIYGVSMNEGVSKITSLRL